VVASKKKTKKPKKVMNAIGYEFKPGCKFSSSKAPIYGKFMQQMGATTPAKVFKAAQPKTSPIHECFTWDKNDAAYKCNLDEARYLLRNIVIVYEVYDKQKPQDIKLVHTRAFVNLKDGVSAFEAGEYEHVKDVMDDKAKRAEYVATALRTLRQWRQNYAGLEELSELFDTIDKFLSKLL